MMHSPEDIQPRCLRKLWASLGTIVDGTPDGIVQVWAVDRGVESLAGADAQDLYQVLADPAGGSRRQR